MRTYETDFLVEERHIDRGEHANWLKQLEEAQRISAVFRTRIGIGLRKLEADHGLFLVMSEVKNVHYYKQLKFRDVVEARMDVWIAGRASLAFRCFFQRGDEVVTQMEWVMPLISIETGRPCRIPPWMTQIIGEEKPETS